MDIRVNTFADMRYHPSVLLSRHYGSTYRSTRDSFDFDDLIEYTGVKSDALMEDDAVCVNLLVNPELLGTSTYEDIMRADNWNDVAFRTVEESIAISGGPYYVSKSVIRATIKAHDCYPASRRVSRGTRTGYIFTEVGRELITGYFKPEILLEFKSGGMWGTEITRYWQWMVKGLANGWIKIH